jgi:hypothetical protein
MGVVLAVAVCVPEIVRLSSRPAVFRQVPAIAARPDHSKPASQAACDRHRPPPRAAGAPRHFVDVTEELGLRFQPAVGPLGSYFMPEVNGAGGAFLDYDGDGDLDIFLVNNGRSPNVAGDFPAGTTAGNRLFRQESNGRFTDATPESGLQELGYGIGCAVGDVNNDGFPDLYVTQYGSDRLYQNQGQGTFTDETAAAGIQSSGWSTCAAFFDYDRDGWLDLIVVKYVADPLHHHRVACGFNDGRVSYCGPLEFSATTDRLFHNDGLQAGDDGRNIVHFTDVTERAGLPVAPTAGFGVVCGDFNGDLWPDFYVANDMHPNRMWINQHNGTFRDEALIRGAAMDGTGMPEGSMGIALGDFDNDGDDDLVTTNLTDESATLFENDGHGGFRDVKQDCGVSAPTRDHTGWGAGLIDLDHDGNLDLAIANGLVVPCHLGFPAHGIESFVFPQARIENAAAFWQAYEDANLLLLNDGQGRFVDRNDLGGDFCAAQGSARSLLFGDIDQDGDLDLLVTNCGARARLYRNDLPKRGHWLMLRVMDPHLRREAYGAEVTVTRPNGPLRRIVNPAGSYLASHDPRVHIGLGDAANYEKIVVRWPDGSTEEFPGGPADRLIELNRGTGRLISDGLTP